MDFQTPGGEYSFHIPDEWWQFAEMGGFNLNGGRFFAYESKHYRHAEGIPIGDIEPLQRSPGLDLFKKYKLIPILFAIRWPEGTLPPVTVKRSLNPHYRYQLIDGTHRYYASVAVGYPCLPIVFSE